MKRLLALAVIFAAGSLAAFLATASGDALSCSTDTAHEVALASVTNLGLGWSSPANPDPLWDVEMPRLNMGVSVYAASDAGARAKAKASLDASVAALGCVTTTAVSTAAPTTTQTVSTSTVTTTVTAPAAPASTVVYVVPTPGPTQTVTEPASVAPVLPPVAVSITVNLKPLSCLRPPKAKR